MQTSDWSSKAAALISFNRVILGSNARQYPTHVIKRPRLAETYDISANHSDALQRDKERRGFSMVRRGGCCDGAAVT